MWKCEQVEGGESKNSIKSITFHVSLFSLFIECSIIEKKNGDQKKKWGNKCSDYYWNLSWKENLKSLKKEEWVFHFPSHYIAHIYNVEHSTASSWMKHDKDKFQISFICFNISLCFCYRCIFHISLHLFSHCKIQC